MSIPQPFKYLWSLNLVTPLTLNFHQFFKEGDLKANFYKFALNYKKKKKKEGA